MLHLDLTRAINNGGIGIVYVFAWLSFISCSGLSASAVSAGAHSLKLSNPGFTFASRIDFSFGEIAAPAITPSAISQPQPALHLRFIESTRYLWQNQIERARQSHNLQDLPKTRGLDVCGQDLDDHIRKVAGFLEVPAALVMSEVAVESSCDNHAISERGAVGYMQVVPTTGALLASKILVGGSKPPTAEIVRDPSVNIWLGTAYLAFLNQSFKTYPVEARQVLVVASYLEGPNAVAEAIRSRMVNTRDQARELLLATFGPTLLTYVDQVLAEESRRNGF